MMDSFNPRGCESYFHGLTINELIILQVRIPPRPSALKAGQCKRCLLDSIISFEQIQILTLARITFNC